MRYVVKSELFWTNLEYDWLLFAARKLVNDESVRHSEKKVLKFKISPTKTQNFSFKIDGKT